MPMLGFIAPLIVVLVLTWHWSHERKTERVRILKEIEHAGGFDAWKKQFFGS